MDDGGNDDCGLFPGPSRFDDGILEHRILLKWASLAYGGRPTVLLLLCLRRPR
jgi:hypothetical protein